MPSRRLRLTLSPFLGRRVPVVIFLAFLAVAFWTGLRTTSGLRWPDEDPLGAGIALYRDMSAAQTMLDSGYGLDPAYVGERTWYNPLSPAILAAVSAATGGSVPAVATQIGTYANLLAPVCFFMMCAVLFDRWTALYSSAGFLFLLPGSLPSWLSATYSPWFMPANFVQAFFYLSIIALHRAERDGRVRAFLAPGLLWGLTFLGHTAPALILGGMTTIGVAAAGWSARRRRSLVGPALRTALLRYALMIIAALCVSAPFVAIIVGHYGLRIKNPVPSANSVSLLSRDLPTLIWLHATVPTLIALVGFWALVTQTLRPTSRRLVLAWIAIASTFLGYSFFLLGARLAGVTLPSVVPSFHFFFYLKAAAAVLFGVGLTALGRIAAAFLARRRGAGTPRRAVVAVGRAAATFTCLILVVAQARTYVTRVDFLGARRGALATATSDQIRVAEWLLAHREPTDVALVSDDRDWVRVFAPSGTKAVVAGAVWSNPYVDLQPRQDARDRMFEALDRDDHFAFRELAEGYQVTYVLTRPPRSVQYDLQVPVDLQLVFSAGDLRLYRVR